MVQFGALCRNKPAWTLQHNAVAQLDGNTFLYTRHLNLYLVAVTRGNVNPAMVFEFLYQKIRIFKAYFKRDFDEDTLRNNMTLILELMDGEGELRGGGGEGA